uniref:Uncharacterized protein n=1 Tax=Nothobranchius pienaari TaxID=704102 RepID=A0A1A8QN28_9TELE
MLRRESDPHGLFTSRETDDNDCEEEYVLSDPQGGSDADADIEDADCRLQDASTLQRISSRRRKRPRVARQDTTESEDDGGRSHRSHRWNIRLSPDRAQSRTILEESVSQVRPLVISGPIVEKQKSPAQPPRGAKPTSLWASLSPPVTFLLSLLVSIFLVVVILCFLLPRTRT